MPGPNALHRDAVLTNMSIKYRNEAMIWPFILPIVKVGKRSDMFFVYNKADAYLLPNDAVGPTAMPNEIDWGVTTDNYSVTDHALSDWLAQESIDNADNPLQPEIDTNDFLNGGLDVAQEMRVVNKAFNPASYPVGNKVQLAGNAQWGGSADDPIGDLEAAIEGCFLRANTIVMGVDVWRVFRKLPEVLDAVKGSSRYQGSPGGLATIDEVKGLFEVENWLIGRSRYNSAKPGQAPTYARLWGKHLAALHVVPKPTVKTVTFGVTFVEALRATYRDFDGKRGVKGAHFFKVAWNSDEHIIASDLGFFIQDAVG